MTGASSGIGLACARAFLAAGDRVIAHYRSQEEPIRELAARWGNERVLAKRADLATEEGCVALLADGPPPQVLVHSAGMWNEGPIARLSRRDLETMFRLNTFSAYYLCREMVRARARDGVDTPACVVMIGSTAGQRGEPGHSHYAGAKAALWGLVQSLAQELGPAVRVNLVSPGWVRTPMAAHALAAEGREQSIVESVPLRRIAEPEDIAASVRFLADDAAARHLTGVDLPLSGGALLPMPRG